MRYLKITHQLVFDGLTKMGGKWFSKLACSFVVLHMILLIVYVLPDQLIPQKVKLYATFYVRPLFHQRWKLFAPDPPLCSCEIQVSFENGLWRSLHQEQEHYLEQRMVQNIARYVQSELHSTEGEIPPILKKTLADACSPHGDPAYAEFRLMERCVTDPQHPGEREIRTTPIEL